MGRRKNTEVGDEWRVTKRVTKEEEGGGCVGQQLLVGAME